MKFLLVILLLAVLLLMLRGLARRARGDADDAAPRRGGPEPPQPMLVCAHCGVHLPRDEALPGRGGVFCGEAHRAAYEQQHPVR
ncbi:MAG TPA: PP0621 family protein [Burkholderiaceae bacterium]